MRNMPRESLHKMDRFSSVIFIFCTNVVQNRQIKPVESGVEALSDWSAQNAEECVKQALRHLSPEVMMDSIVLDLEIK